MKNLKEVIQESLNIPVDFRGDYSIESIENGILTLKGKHSNECLFTTSLLEDFLKTCNENYIKTIKSNWGTFDLDLSESVDFNDIEFDCKFFSILSNKKDITIKNLKITSSGIIKISHLKNSKITFKNCEFDCDSLYISGFDFPVFDKCKFSKKLVNDGYIKIQTTKSEPNDLNIPKDFKIFGLNDTTCVLNKHEWEIVYEPLGRGMFEKPLKYFKSLF